LNSSPIRATLKRKRTKKNCASSCLRAPHIPQLRLHLRCLGGRKLRWRCRCRCILSDEDSISQQILTASEDCLHHLSTEFNMTSPNPSAGCLKCTASSAARCNFADPFASCCFRPLSLFVCCRSKRLSCAHVKTLKMTDDVMAVKFSPDQRYAAPFPPCPFCAL